MTDQKIDQPPTWRRTAAHICRVAFSMVPFLGRMEFSNWEAWKKTALQTSVSVILSSLPIWIVTIALLFGKAEPTLADSIRYAIKNGELLLLSSSAVSPLLYLVATTKTTKANRFLTSFPHGLFYIVFTLLVIIACAVFITLRAVSGHPPASPSDQIGGTMFPWSLWLYAFSVFLYFTATFHKNAASDADARSLIVPGEAEFGTAWENR